MGNTFNKANFRTIALTFFFLIVCNTANSATKWSCQPAGDGRQWACDSNAPIVAKTDGNYMTSDEAFAAREEQPIIRRPDLASRQARTVTDHTYLDWYPKQVITPEQLAQAENHCVGVYIEPPLPPTGEGFDINNPPFYASAENADYVEGKVAIYTGDVRLRLGNQRISSDEARWYQQENTADLKGNVRLREPGVLVVSETANANLDTGEVSATDVEYVLHDSHIRGQAATVNRDKQGIVYISDGTYTTCEPVSNAWELVGSDIKLNKETGVGTAKHVRLKVKGVPVLYTPYLRFPIDNRRKSGFLMPTAGFSSDGGVDIATPYYLNLAPNYDATITPRYISDRGFMLESEFRYLAKLWGDHDGYLGGAYLLNDDEYGDDRWLVGWQHDGTILTKRLRTRVDYTRVSDNEYFSDLGTDLQLTSQTHLDQLGELSYRAKHWDLTARAQGYQTIDRFIDEDDIPYDRLPQVYFEGSYPHQATGLEFSLESEYVYFDRDNTGILNDSLSNATGQRIHVEPGVSWPFEWAWGYVTPTVKLKHTRYILEDEPNGVDDTPTRTLPVANIDAGLFFDRKFTSGNKAMTQTLEPRVYYLYVPYEDQSEIPDFDTSELTFEYNQLFREDRFIGGDRVGDTHQLSLGLTTRVFADETGFEHLRASIGQIYYFKDRRVTLDGKLDEDLEDDMSAIAGELVYRFNDDWHVRGDFEWDPNDSELDKGTASFRYQPDVDHIINAGYRYRRGGIEQAEASFIWPIPIYHNWSAIGRYHYGLDINRTVEAIAGLEYESCCWRLRVIYRNWLDDDGDDLDADAETDSGVFVQFQLRGLGGIGNKVDSILDDGIAGYREREDYGHY